MKYIRIFCGECYRGYIELKRYPLESFLFIFWFVFLFMLLFFFAESLVKNLIPNTTQTQFQENIRGVFAGYCAWLIFMQGIQLASRDLYNDIQTGLLEQIFLAPIAPSMLLLFRALGRIIFLFLALAVILGIMILILQIPITISIPFFCFVAFFIAIGSIGIGLFLAGITLLYQRIYMLIMAIIWMCFLLAMIDLPEHGITAYLLKLFPLSQGMRLLQVMFSGNTQGIHLFLTQDVIWLFCGALLFLFLGIKSFDLCDRIARKHGLLTQY